MLRGRETIAEQFAVYSYFEEREEQLRLIQELEEKDKTIIFSMLETMLTKQKFKDFFNKNVAML